MRTPPIIILVWGIKFSCLALFTVPSIDYMLVAAALVLMASASIEKEVVHTSWWPPGSEKTAEAVGITSRGLVFMTGMMADYDTFLQDVREDRVVSDIMDVSSRIARRLGAALDL